MNEEIIPESHEPYEENVTSHLEDEDFVDIMFDAIMSELRGDKVKIISDNSPMWEYALQANEIIGFSIDHKVGPYQASKLMGYSPIEPSHRFIVKVAIKLYNNLEL